MFRLAHLSDPHLPMTHARPMQLLNKRATGYYNWWRHRVHLHLPEALSGVVADIKAQRPDHIALTGDLVNVSLPQEFRRAARHAQRRVAAALLALRRAHPGAARAHDRSHDRHRPPDGRAPAQIAGGRLAEAADEPVPCHPERSEGSMRTSLDPSLRSG